jgi:hypothetical protein
MPREIIANKSLTSAMFPQALGGPFGTVPELLFEKKQLIPPVQQLLAAGPSAGE